jgi:hypothetical protein
MEILFGTLLVIVVLLYVSMNSEKKQKEFYKKETYALAKKYFSKNEMQIATMYDRCYLMNQPTPTRSNMSRKLRQI